MPDKEQSPSVTELVRRLAEDGQLGSSTDAPPELMALAQLVLELADKIAPTPDLGEDEELCERLRKQAKCIYIAVEESVADDIADAENKAADRLEALHAEREKLTSDAEVQAKTAIAIGDALEDQGVELSPPQMIYVAGIALEAAIAALNASPKDSPDAP
jgi:hypothetical protein